MPEQQASTVGPLLSILETLVPTRTVTVTDGTGATHVLQGALPARRQIEALRKMESLKDVIMSDESIVTMFKEAGGQGGQPIAALIDAFAKLAGDEKVLSSLADAFQTAHPKATRDALEEAVKYDPELEASEVDAADLFPVEELIAGLLPFSVRLVKRATEALGAVTAATQNDQA